MRSTATLLLKTMSFTLFLITAGIPFKQLMAEGQAMCEKLTTSEYGVEDISNDHAYLVCYKDGFERYDFDWRSKGSSSWEVLTGDARMRRQIEDLSPNTDYEYRARYWCDGGWNEWSDIKEFRTTAGGGGIDCSRLSSNEYDAEDINDTYAYLACYKGGYERYDFDWRSKGTSNWSELIGDAQMRRRIEDLSPNTTYEYRARYWCDGGWNDWSDNKEFTTTNGGGGVDCSKLTSSEYAAEDINDTYAYLACYKDGYERYDFDWRLQGNSQWQELQGNSEMRRRIENLIPNRTYEYRARYWCDGNWNEWSDNKEFMTTAGSGGNDCSKLTSNEYAAEDVNDTYAFLACYKGGYERYDFDWRRKGTSTWSELIGDEQMRRRIEDLSPNTTYEYRARYWCDGEWNEWSDNKEFTTTTGGNNDCSKLTSGEYDAEDINDTYAFLTCYKDGYERYDFDWRVKGTTTWSTLTGDERMQRRIDNLSPNTTYEYRARYWCNGEWNEWSDNKEFTTTTGGGGDNCEPLMSGEYDAEDVNDTYAYLACYKSGYERYDFDWRIKGTTTWSTLTGDERMQRRIDNLSPNTTYEYRARYWCNGEWNEWSDNKEFTTTAGGGGDNCAKLTTDEYDVEDINDTYAYLACYIDGFERYDFDWRRKGTTNWSTLTGDERMRRLIDDLTPNATYEYRARYWCDGGWNEWSDNKEFTTTMESSSDDCDQLTSNEYSVEDVNDTYANLVCYKSGYERYDFDWRPTGNSDWSTLTGDDRSNRRIENLSSNTTYEYRARYWCNGEWNEWSDNKEFTTTMGQESCTPLVDGDYDAEEITATDAYLVCYKEYDNYQFRYRSGTEDWIETSMSSQNRVQIDELMDGTEYEYQARYSCGEQFSDWSASRSFMTEMSTNSQKFAINEWEMFPNPAQEWLHLQLNANADPFQLIISDFNGRQVMRQQLIGGVRNSIHLNLPAGMYLLQIEQDDKIGRKKLIIR